MSEFFMDFTDGIRISRFGCHRKPLSTLILKCFSFHRFVDLVLVNVTKNYNWLSIRISLKGVELKVHFCQ